MGAGRADAIEEILANKICTLVGRAEVRDFWDVHALAQRGCDIDRALALANQKDGGVDAESLLYVLSEIRLAEAVPLASAAGLAGWDDVVAFFSTLQDRLARRLAGP